jgi:hypothetical protein
MNSKKAMTTKAIVLIIVTLTAIFFMVLAALKVMQPLQ